MMPMKMVPFPTMSDEEQHKTATGRPMTTTMKQSAHLKTMRHLCHIFFPNDPSTIGCSNLCFCRHDCGKFHPDGEPDLGTFPVHPSLEGRDLATSDETLKPLLSRLATPAILQRQLHDVE